VILKSLISKLKRILRKISWLANHFETITPEGYQVNLVDVTNFALGVGESSTPSNQIPLSFKQLLTGERFINNNHFLENWLCP